MHSNMGFINRSAEPPHGCAAPKEPIARGRTPPSSSDRTCRPDSILDEGRAAKTAAGSYHDPVLRGQNTADHTASQGRKNPRHSSLKRAIHGPRASCVGRLTYCRDPGDWLYRCLKNGTAGTLPRPSEAAGHPTSRDPKGNKAGRACCGCFRFSALRTRSAYAIGCTNRSAGNRIDAMAF